ncbi:hypothetical protein AOLE_03990 [Acinetobacter oleivorans DR1]|jgi:hypothetical protein|uniref:Uncharacterized protein n=1 Tax=Acinetobacter oleivorans (strain JCM 16667 / KCTC 23045 / DR1) TaxID=436717 RepID=A0AAN0P6I0_ACISD|nr:hypothetical protein AOLE_03990 [Acinetobacter oleivorans DR1]
MKIKVFILRMESELLNEKNKRFLLLINQTKMTIRKNIGTYFYKN